MRVGKHRNQDDGSRSMVPMSPHELRRQVLESLGARDAVLDELMAYNQSAFDPQAIRFPLRLPLAPASHLPAWEEYATRARHVGGLAALQEVLVQLRFPIRAGISASEEYRAATLRGEPVPAPGHDGGLYLEHPDQVELAIHHAPAGPLPVVTVPHRPDFETLVRALAMRNEPGVVPRSMGAATVRGLNNWDRIPAPAPRVGGCASPGRPRGLVGVLPRPGGAAQGPLPGRLRPSQPRGVQPCPGGRRRPRPRGVATLFRGHPPRPRVRPLPHLASLRLHAQLLPGRTGGGLCRHDRHRGTLPRGLVPSLHGAGGVSSLPRGGTLPELPGQSPPSLPRRSAWSRRSCAERPWRWRPSISAIPGRSATCATWACGCWCSRASRWRNWPTLPRPNAWSRPWEEMDDGVEG